jgi:hypothetical protein
MGQNKQPEYGNESVLFTACVVGCGTCPDGRVFLVTENAGFVACAQVLANTGVPGTVLQQEQDCQSGRQRTSGLESSAAACINAKVCPYRDSLPAVVAAVRQSLRDEVEVVIERPNIVQ